MLLLLMLAGTILSSGGSYWLGERRMQADLEFLRSHGAVTEIPVPKGKATYQDALELWYSLPARKRANATKWIETYKVKRYKESKEALSDIAPVLTVLEITAQEPNAEWRELDDALHSFADFLSSRAVLEASEGRCDESMATLRVLRRLSEHAQDYGGVQGFLLSQSLEDQYFSTAFLLAQDPDARALLAADVQPLPTPSVSQILREEVARSIAVTETAEYREFAPVWARLPENVPPALARAAVGNRTVKRAVKHKLVRAWAEVMPHIDQSLEELTETVRDVYARMKQDKSFSGRIAAERFEAAAFIADKLGAMEKDDEERLQKLRELLR
jgi:hypothetical protein